MKHLSLAAGNDTNRNELIALADYNDQSSVVKLSFDVDSILATPFLEEKDYGLRPYAWWKKHGKSLSTDAYHRSDDLVVVMADEVKKMLEDSTEKE